MDFQAVRLAAHDKRPYFAVALCALTIVPLPGLGTCQIDRFGRVYWDPELDWKIDEAAWALLHELNHWLRDHFHRATPYLDMAECKSCEARLINKLQDCEINDDLEREGGRLPNHDIRCFPRTYGLTPGKLWEQYYQEIKDREEQIDQHGDCESYVLCGSAAHGLKLPHEVPDPGAPNAPPGFTAAEVDLIRDQVARDILQNQGYGNVSAGMLRWAQDRLRPPQVAWERELTAQTQAALTLSRGVGDYSYAHFNRRYGSVTRVLMPAVVRPNSDVAVVIDTSGSMSEAEDLPDVLSEIPGVLRAVGQRAVHVICCDSVASPAQLVQNVAQIQLMGGGGTDMGAGIESAVKLGAKVILVLTDGFTPWPERIKPGVQVVVGVVGYASQEVEVPPPFHKRVVRIKSRKVE